MNKHRLVKALDTLLLAVAMAAPSSKAQDAAPPLLFDVASIRLTASTDHDRTHIWSSPRDGLFRAQNVSITDLLEAAYALPDSRFIAPGPARALLRSPRFDLEAKSSAAVDTRLQTLAAESGNEAARQEKRKLIQALLAERFQLKTHLETRELPIYTLVPAKGGPRFTASIANGTTSSGRGTLKIEGGNNSVGKLADYLAAVLGRPVLDQTGINGSYLIALRWMPDDGPAPLLNGEPDSSLPSIFTAVEEQLGLKLIASKGPVEVLVIDQVELPSPN